MFKGTTNRKSILYINPKKKNKDAVQLLLHIFSYLDK
jgi:hypothetical protein